MILHKDKRISELKYKRGCNLLFEATEMALNELLGEHIITNSNLRAVAMLQAVQRNYKAIMQAKTTTERGATL